MGTLTRNFSFSEFKCPCGRCSYVDGYQIDQKFVRDLQIIRDGLGKAIKINSGLRCDSYNRTVNGVSNSYHIVGKAADLACTNSHDRHRIIKIALSLNLSLYYTETFIHLDKREGPIVFLL